MLNKKIIDQKLIDTSLIIPAKARTWYAPLENPEIADWYS